MRFLAVFISTILSLSQFYSELFKVQSSIPNYPPLLPQFICKAVIDVRKQDSGFQSLILATGETKFPNSFQDNIFKCLPKEVPVILVDFREQFLNVSIHQVSMVVMITDEINEVSNLASTKPGWTGKN
jgi:hypothetical protein